MDNLFRSRGISSPTPQPLTPGQDNARAYTPIPTSQHGLPQSHIPTCLQAAKYVFIHHDAHHGPLQPPYDGSSRLLETRDKHLVVDTGSEPECLSIDRLKPAHLDLDWPVEMAQPPGRGRPSAPPLHSSKTSADSPMGAPAPAPVLRSRYGRTIRPPTF